jgi:hypothetical protein
LVGKESSISLKAIDQEEAEGDQAVILKHLVAIQKVRGIEEETAKEMARKGEIDPTEFAAFFNDVVDRDTNDGLQGEKEDDDPDNTKHNLPMGPRVDVPILHAALKGYQAVRILESRPLPDGRFHLEMLCIHLESGERSRLSLNLRSDIQSSKAVEPSLGANALSPTKNPSRITPKMYGVLGLGIGFALGLIAQLS